MKVFYLTALGLVIGIISFQCRVSYADPIGVGKIAVEPVGDEMLCDYLKEKMDIFIALNDSVSDDFFKVTDAQLCYSMSSQCEYFYRKAVEYQKMYRKECDDNFQMIALSKCDYSENGCTKAVPRFNTSSNHANSSRW